MTWQHGSAGSASEGSNARSRLAWSHGARTGHIGSCESGQANDGSFGRSLLKVRPHEADLLAPRASSWSTRARLLLSSICPQEEAHKS